MIYAISGDYNFIQKINHSKLSGFVHSTFKRTINIQCLEDGELYTIACKEIDNGPNTIIIDLHSFEDLRIDAYDKVYLDSNIISVGNKMSITIDRIKSWECILPIYPVNTEILEGNLCFMRNYIGMQGTSGGIKGKPVNTNPFETEMAKMISERTYLLENSLVSKQMQHAIQHAVSLIGLGPGLTPSGDDYLVGLFTSFHLENSPLSSYKLFCEEVEKVAKTGTNEISYIALKKASTGLIRESLISLINALFNENEVALKQSLSKVLSIGSSSGTDIALGILSGLEANIKIGGTL